MISSDIDYVNAQMRWLNCNVERSLTATAN